MLLSLAYLLLTIVLSYMYFIVILYIGISFIHFIKVFFTTKWGCFGCLPDIEKAEEGYFKRFKAKLHLSFSDVLPRKKLIIFFALTVTLSTVLYIDERDAWRNDKALHTDAKEYFASGQVLSSYRRVLGEFIKPDNPILFPLNALQSQIYKSGTAYLPKEDAEDALWYQMWFLYPYTQRDYIPFSETKDADGKYPQHKWLDTLWPYLEKLATHTIADPNMQIEYLKNYPGLAFYYSLNQSAYYILPKNQLIDSEHNPLFFILQTPQYYDRNRLMQLSMQRYHEMYENHDMHNRFGKKHPKIEVLSIAARLTYDEFLVRYAILHGQFRCDLPYLLDWAKYQNIFTGEHRDGVVYLLKKRELKHMHHAFIDGPDNYFYKYIAQEICGHRVYAMKDEEFQIPWGDKPWSEDDEYRTVRRWYEKELNLIDQSLKGVNHGN